MISAISGVVKYKSLSSLIVDVSGVGYEIFVPTDVALEATTNKPIDLWTHLAVRENALDLFGFRDRESLDMFELLINISGIGPKTALNILNIASPTTLRQAVASEDTSYLTRVSGIGKKNAEKIVLELKDKLVVTKEERSANFKADGDALEALVSLGYAERDARDALKKVPKEIEDASTRVKEALKILAKN